MTEYEFHRLGRLDPRYRWWRPLLVAVLAFGLYLVFALAVVAGVELAAALVLPEDDYADYRSQLAGGNVVLTNPFALLAVLGGVAVMLPALVLARLILRAGPLGLLSSVAGHIRWRWLWIAMLPAVGYILLQFLLGFVIAPAVDDAPLGEPTVPLAIYLVSLAIILLLVPVQATAEEYVFRGFVLQMLGGWVRWPALVIVLSTIPFVLGHLYNWWGLAEVLAFALVGAWLTIRTGGLEAVIGVHVLTNISVLSITALGFSGIEAADGTPLATAITVVLLPLYAAVVVALFTRSGLSRTARRDPAMAPPGPS